MKKIIYFLTVFLMCQGLFAQGHIQVINSGANYDLVQASITEYSSGIYIIAATAVDLIGNSHIVVVKTNDTGSILWSKNIQYLNRDSFVGSVIVDQVGHIVLTGYMGTNEGVTKNLILVKLDSNGNLVNDTMILDHEDYGLYGFDVVQAYDGAYLVVGAASHAPFVGSSYAFVLRITPDLGNLIWVKKYNSDNATHQYDVFNHILKIPDYNGQPAYLLTGSGAQSSSNKQMLANDLIDLTGTSLWPMGPVGHRWTTADYIQPGIAGWYDGTNFHVISSGVENWPVLFELDGNNGMAIRKFRLLSSWGLNSNVNMINSMWQGVSVGYYVHPNTSQGWPMSVSLNSTAPSPHPTTWEQYASGIDGNALRNLNFDSMVDPFNFTSSVPIFSYMKNQMYYRPKAIVENFSSGVKFVAPTGGSPTLGIAFINNNARGNVDCRQIINDNSNSFSTGTTEYNFGAQNYYTFAPIGPGANVGPSSIVSHVICQPPSPKPFMGTNNATNQEIKIYPNPASDKLFVSGLQKVKNVELVLYDMQGRKILSQLYEENAEKVQLDVSNLQNGIYFLKVSGQQEILLVERVGKK